MLKLLWVSCKQLEITRTNIKNNELNAYQYDNLFQQL